jgi:Rrf2 family protein
MKLSKKGEYALRALIDLGIGSEVGRSLLQVTEIAEKEKLPIKFLEQVMQHLKEGGFIQSQRGKFGGYRLARPANQITMGQVVRLIDGPLAPIGCVSQTAYEPCSCPDEVHCGLRMLMLDVRNAIAGILDRYSLAGRRRSHFAKDAARRSPFAFQHLREVVPPNGDRRRTRPTSFRTARTGGGSDQQPLFRLRDLTVRVPLNP